MSRQKRKGGDAIGETNMFDNLQYYQDEISRLYGIIYEMEQDRSTLLKCMGRLESETVLQKAEIDRLMVVIRSHENLDDEVKIPLLKIVNHCKNCQTRAEVRPIREMLYKVLRCIGRPADYELIDSIDECFNERERTRKEGTNINNSIIYQGGSIHEDKSHNLNVKQGNDKLLTDEE